jgi:hypothetical protein
VSVGMYEETLDLPAMQRVVGGSLVSPGVWEQNAGAKPAGGPLRLRYASLAGTMNQLGASRMSIEEY